MGLYNNQNNLKHEKSSNASMMDKNSLMSKHSWVSRDMLVSQLLKNKKNFNSGSGRDL